jgi:hypothetical protein
MHYRKQLCVMFVLAFAAPVQSQDLNRVGDCSNTTIESIGTRLPDDDDSGSAVCFTNGVCQVDYDSVPAVERSRKGDPVRMCLVSVERNCPRDTAPVHEYRCTNLRTRESWTMNDHSHSCRGA